MRHCQGSGRDDCLLFLRDCIRTGAPMLDTLSFWALLGHTCGLDVPVFEELRCGLAWCSLQHAVLIFVRRREFVLCYGLHHAITFDGCVLQCRWLSAMR